MARKPKQPKAPPKPVELERAPEVEAASELTTDTMKSNAAALAESCVFIRQELAAAVSQGNVELAMKLNSHLVWTDEKAGRVLDSVRKYDAAQIDAIRTLSPERLDRLVTEYLLDLHEIRLAAILKVVGAKKADSLLG